MAFENQRKNQVYYASWHSMIDWVEERENCMHGLEWVFSVVLSIVFLVTGINKIFRYEKSLELFAWVKHVPRTLAQVIGLSEMLGALGLVLPAATGILPWLTPVAAIALALVMLLAVGFHMLRGEKNEAPLAFLLMLLLALVAFMRWPLIP